MIIRVEHRSRYTVIANAALRDDRLSFRATGVLAYILTFHNEVQIGGARLASVKREGRDAVLGALTELETAGYLRREREQGPDGKWRTVCVVHEIQPSPENPDSVPGNRTVTSHQPSPEKPNVGFPGPKELSTENEVLGLPPWKPDGSKVLTAEERINGLERLRAFREGH